jgi:diacylglycerol kinase family enzyme
MQNPSTLVILNLKSGSRDKRQYSRQLKECAERIGVVCDIITVRGYRQLVAAAQQAAKSSYETVIAGGGDGTINAVATELIGTGKVLGVLPMGTFNYLARELGVPSDLEDAFRACFQSEVSTICAGEVNGRIFLNNASIGLYPVILSLREQAYKRWGRSRMVAYWCVLKALFRLRINLKMTLSAEGRTWPVRTPLVFVARNSYQLREFGIAADASIGGRFFSICVLPAAGKLGLLRIALKAVTRRLERAADYKVFQAEALRIELPGMFRRVGFDGETASLSSPLLFKISERPLRVLRPRREGRQAA